MSVAHAPVAERKAQASVSPTLGADAIIIGALAALATAWPLLYAILRQGPKVLIRCLTGDSYHYLAIARKALDAHSYTYDGVHVTNGFHPLWEWILRGLFTALQLRSHESEAIAAIAAALVATTLGAALAAAAIVRLTGHKALGLLVVPGVYYLVAGVHVHNLWLWASMDGMESALSILFGGLFFLLLSFFIGASAPSGFDLLRFAKASRWVLPLIVLSRLDDIFLLPGLWAAILLFEPERRRQFRAILTVSLPTIVAALAYMLYNKVTVGAAMPLSGGTKSGFAGPVFTYLAAGLHLPMILDLKQALTHTPYNPEAIWTNSFRFVEVLYPLVAAAFGAAVLWRYRRRAADSLVWFALCVYVLIKMGYNLLMVHPWHQADWYYALIMLSLSIMAAQAIAGAWTRLETLPLARTGTVTIYCMLLLLASSQYYVSIAFQSPKEPAQLFWAHQQKIRAELVQHGVTGILNDDDGITAFLMDMPNLHGFAFATDVEAQKAHQAGRMLSLAYSRGINSIAGAGYLSAETAPETDSEIHTYLQNSLAWETMKGEANNFEFSLAYWDPELKMPFFTFRPRP